MTDSHEETARRIFGCDDITPEMRTRAKAINFGGCYGTRPSDLADMVNLTDLDRQRLMDQWEDYFIPLFGQNASQCSWCEEEVPLERLTDGAGECVGQKICSTCILRRDG